MLVLHWVRRWSRLVGGTVATGTPTSDTLRSDLPDAALAALRDQVDSPTDQRTRMPGEFTFDSEKDQPG